VPLGRSFSTTLASPAIGAGTFRSLPKPLLAVRSFCKSHLSLVNSECVFVLAEHLPVSKQVASAQVQILSLSLSLQNASRAVVEHHSRIASARARKLPLSSTAMPPIVAQVCKGTREVTIKVRERMTSVDSCAAYQKSRTAEGKRTAFWIQDRDCFCECA
jgi:hypothetical protein